MLSSSAAAIASTRKQLIQICNHKRLDKSIIAPLRNRVVIHYTGHIIAREGTAGRFPAQAEARVAADVRRELAGRDVGYGYGSLACGADTLIVEALVKRGAEVDVVLPFETLTFVKQSVAVGGANWTDRFESCLKQVRLIHATEGEYVGDPEVFAYASRLAMGLAILRAQQLSSEPIQLAVWDGQETAEKAGSFADIQAWQSQGLKTVTIGSDGNLAANGEKPAEPERSYHSLPARKVRAIMFGDFHGFSRLSDRQMLTFYNQMMQRIAAVLDRFAGDVAARNTWGDGLFVVFEDLGAAARCAMQIQSTLSGLDLLSLGLPASLGLRLGLDAGAVFEVHDPILRSPTFTGTHISRTARLEPSTPSGEVYVTEAFAALFTLIEDKELICDYVGLMRAAKNYGRLRTYLLRRRAYA
jgi:class 3 adenylate cyclase